MVSEHPKITAYIPQSLLDALDAWKETHNHSSRNSAFVAILEKYLGVTHPVTHEGTLPSSVDLSAVLETLETLKQRMDAVEAVLSTLQGTAPDNAPNALTQRIEQLEKAIAPLTQAVAQVETLVSGDSDNDSELIAEDTSEGEGETEDTKPPVSLSKRPLTQKELSERLGTSTQNLSNRRGRGTSRDKATFEAWSQRHDPDGVAWTWVGRPGGKGIPMRYVPVV